jgi:transcription elongation factor Elf1
MARGDGMMLWDKLFEQEMKSEPLCKVTINELEKAQIQYGALISLYYDIKSLNPTAAQCIHEKISDLEDCRDRFFSIRVRKIMVIGNTGESVFGLNGSLLNSTWIEESILRAVQIHLDANQLPRSKNKDKYDCTDRGSTRYTAWRWSVLLKDNFTCQRCGKRSDLEAHHIVPYHENKELATDVNNGLTLCKDCHKAHHSENGYKTKGAFA